MKLKNLYPRFLSLIDPAGAKKYVTQVSLLLISLLIATTADRYRQQWKNQVKLQEYLSAIDMDIQEELDVCTMNLKDCQNDILALAKACYYTKMQSVDSINYGLSNFSAVYQRGVFRTFAPTTFEIMTQAGDVDLIKDLTLRSNLAMVFAFRDGTIRKDLEDFDRETEQCARQLGQYVDLSTLLERQITIVDPKGFQQSPHNEFFLLLKMANVRAFHLTNAIDDLQKVQKSLQARIKNSGSKAL